MKKLFKIYKEYVGLIIETIQLILYMTSVFTNFIFFWNLYLKLESTIKILIITFCLLLTTFLIILIRRLINKLRYEIPLIQYQKNNEKITSKNEKIFYNFENIIPSTKLLQESEKILSKELKKSWTKDIVISGAELYIHADKDILLHFDPCFLLESSNITAKIRITNFEFIPGDIMEKTTLTSYSTEINDAPFYNDSNWRKAVIDSLKSLEVEIINRGFTMNLSSIGGLRIFIIPNTEGGVDKPRQFFYKNQTLTKTVNDKEEVIRTYKI